MPTLTFPTLRVPSTLIWSLQSATREHTSFLSGSVRTIATLGARWRFQATWPSLDRTERIPVETFLIALNGRAGRFYFTPPEYKRPKGTATAGTVNGGGQTGSALIVNIGANRTLLQGDYFVVNGELKRMTATATASGTGAATLAFGPPLRESPLHTAALTFANPTATFMLTDDTQGLSIGPGGFADFNLDAVEAYL